MQLYTHTSRCGKYQSAFAQVLRIVVPVLQLNNTSMLFLLGLVHTQKTFFSTQTQWKI